MRARGHYMGMARWIRTGSLAAAFLIGGAGAAPAWAGAPSASEHVLGGDLSSQAWEAASRGDNDKLMQLLTAGGESDPKLAQGVALLKSNIEAREAKRKEQSAKQSAELDKILAGDRDEISLALALKTVIEMHMLALDKAAVLSDPRALQVARESEAAAKAAEKRGDWLTASDLYSRLNLLYEEQGKFKDDVKREIQRLTMIRMYVPEKLWEQRNSRRNAEIAWKDKHKDIADDSEDERVGTSEADSKARKEADKKPLPPYNPMGDGYKEKLAGIDEAMVLGALGRANARHVEKTAMDKILHDGIDSIRTMATTTDLRGAFAGLASDHSRSDFLAFLDIEDAKLDKAGPMTGRGDLKILLDRLLEENNKTVQIPESALLHEFGTGGMQALDEFSTIIWPDEVRRFNRNTQGRFVGVGIQIEMDPLWNIRVVTPLEDTPAQHAGIRPGDLIRKVDGTSTEGFSLDQAVDVITGPTDTQVVLTIERGGESGKSEIEVPLRRQEINVATVKGWKRTGAREGDWDWYIDQGNKIGYVRLTQFADRTDAELDKAIDQMKQAGLSGLILDLRFNPGGLLDQAVAVVSRFIDARSAKHNDGMVVTTHEKDNTLRQQEPVLAGKARLAGIPVVVLINEGSASASEIVSGALQDYAKAGDLKAVLIGARSFGKGSVQNVWPMENGHTQAAVKVTTQYYHLPAGRMIHRLTAATQWGVEPNMKVEMLPTQTADAFLLRQNADVVKLGERGPLAAAPGAPAPADPQDLISKGMDLQLETALILLQTQTAGTGQAMLDKPSTNN
jgi:carboxyl-terminal processing protease